MLTKPHPMHPMMPPMIIAPAANGPYCSESSKPMMTTRSAFVTAVILVLLAFVLLSPVEGQGTVMPYARIAFYDNSGNACNGCLLDTWIAGTTTNQATYSDSALATANANPVVMDSSGRATVFVSQTSYRFRLRTAAGATLWDVDNVTAVPTTSGNTDITGTAGVAIALGEVVYLSDGSNSLTAGRWYLADADLYYGSIHPVLGVATAAIASGATGTIRVAGTITGLSGLTSGTTYYVSGTAGAVTATAPANARGVGQALSTTSIAIHIASAWILDAGQALQTMDGRLTLTTVVPVTTADVTAAATLYYTPYKGNRVVLFDGSRWKAYSFSELSLTITCTASNTYDVWLYDNAGTLTLETLIWTNATTRATALALQNGVLSRTGSLTRRYIGSFYCTATNQTEDSFARRMLWNYYNRVQRGLRVTEATSTWTYTTATIRQANGSTANQVDTVIGVAEVSISLVGHVTVSNDTAAVAWASMGIGQDSTTAFTTGSIWSGLTYGVANGRYVAHCAFNGFPAIGRHFFTWLERSTVSGITTWAGAGTEYQSGLTGFIEG